MVKHSRKMLLEGWKQWHLCSGRSSFKRCVQHQQSSLFCSFFFFSFFKIFGEKTRNPTGRRQNPSAWRSKLTSCCHRNHPSPLSLRFYPLSSADFMGLGHLSGGFWGPTFLCSNSSCEFLQWDATFTSVLHFLRFAICLGVFCLPRE